MVRAIYPGSFDPVTYGHLDIIKRSSKIFDELIVCVLNNSGKKSPLFSLEERVKMLCDVLSDYDNVKVSSSDGLLVDFAKQNDVSIIVRGLRGMSDFDFEFQMAQVNKTISTKIETVFMATEPSLSYISSSIVKEFASYGKSVKDLVPEIVLHRVEEKYNIL